MGDDTSWPRQQHRPTRYSSIFNFNCKSGNPIATAASKSQWCSICSNAFIKSKGAMPETKIPLADPSALVVTCSGQAVRCQAARSHDPPLEAQKCDRSLRGSHSRAIGRRSRA
eukprot:9423982-Pyramimonas_sp.AAC.1